jgi:hypothetical protein
LCKLLNVYVVEEFYKPEKHTTEKLVPEQSLSDIHIAIKKLDYKSPGSDLFADELTQADGRMLHS